MNDSVSLIAEHRDRPGLMLALVGHEAMRRLRDTHTQHGLSPRQFEVLGLLHDRGPLAQTELGKLTRTPPNLLVTYLNPLEAEQLITRRRDPADRRRHVVTLTANGETRLRAASRAQHDTEDTLFQNLTTAQRTQLQGILKQLREHLIQGETNCATTGSLEKVHD